MRRDVVSHKVSLIARFSVLQIFDCLFLFAIFGADMEKCLINGALGSASFFLTVCECIDRSGYTKKCQWGALPRFEHRHPLNLTSCFA